MNDEHVPYGLYEQLIDRALAGRLDHATGQGATIEREGVDPGEVHDRVAAHLAHLLRHVIAAAPVDDRVDLARRLVHDVIDAAARHLDEPERLAPLGDELEMLLAVSDPTTFGQGPPRPHVPLADHDPLVMGRDEPAVGAEIRRELASADQADLRCAFITWPGFRVLVEPLTELVTRGGRFRVITTTYMGATERRALDELAQLGAGKTVVAALDYKRLCHQHGDLSLLFVAHRREILEQSRRTFAEALSDAAFGELLVGGQQPRRGAHVFASAQSLHAERLGQLDPAAFA